MCRRELLDALALKDYHTNRLILAEYVLDYISALACMVELVFREVLLKFR